MTEVVASILPRTPDEAVRQARSAAMAGADWLELRLDAWPAAAPLDAVLGEIGLPVLVACRQREDGGAFPGSAVERRALLTKALAAGAAGIDLEERESWAPSPRPRLVVRSLHDHGGVPADLRSCRDRLLALGGDVAKIAVHVEDLADAAPVLELMASTEHRREPTVAFALGETAWPTRVLAALLGAPFVYGCIEPALATAPGQVPVKLLVELYRVRSMGPRTQVFGLLGLPARHSWGPWLHNRLFRRHRIDAVYLPLESARPEEVVAMLPVARLGGLSVTAPHKERARRLCQRQDGPAVDCGAVNTLCFDAGHQIVGRNTDVIGVMSALRAVGFGEGAGRAAAVLGVGGSARASAVALERLGYRVVLFGRRPERVADFAKARGYGLQSLDAASLRAVAAAVVVQATPIGSAGTDTENQRVLPDWTPAAGVAALDLVYRPRVTPWLAAAIAAGAVGISGIEVFLAQAVAQAAHFTGVAADIEDMRLWLP